MDKDEKRPPKRASDVQELPHFECPTGCREFLIRLDERTRRIESSLTDVKAQLRSEYARQTNVLELKETVRSLEMKTEDLPTVKKIVFGAVAVILLAVVGGLVALVVNK